MAAPQAPSVTSSFEGIVPVITPVGDFDIANLYLLRDQLQDALATGDRVVLDLSGTTFVDSTVLGLMVECTKRATENGGWLRVAAPRSNVHRVLRLMALDTIIGIHPSVEDAIGPVAEGEVVAL